MTCEQPSTSSPPRFRLLRPRHWRSKHRAFLQLTEEKEVPLERIVGSEYLPRDGDKEFEYLCEQFELAGSGPFSSLHFAGRRFREIRGSMNMLRRMETQPDSYDDRDYFDYSKGLLRQLVDTLLEIANCNLNHRLSQSAFSEIRFRVTSLGAKCVIRGAPYIGNPDKSMRPLATTATIKPHGNEDPIVHEIPQMLIQAGLAFRANEEIEHTSFVLRTYGRKLQFSEASIPRAYMESLYQGGPFQQGFKLLRSRVFHLRKQRERREIVRGFVGLLRRLDDVQSNW